MYLLTRVKSNPPGYYQSSYSHESGQESGKKNELKFFSHALHNNDIFQETRIQIFVSIENYFKRFSLATFTGYYIYIVSMNKIEEAEQK